MDNAPVALTGSAWVARLTAIWEFLLRQRRTHATLLKFTLVGMVGYLLYTGALFLVYDSGLLPFLPDKNTSVRLGLFTHSDVRLLIGTLAAAQVSITGGFFARDLWVFRGSPVVRKPGWRRFLEFQAKSLVSTLGILTVTVNVLTEGLGLAHYVSTPIGISIAFVWNWLWESRFIWRRASRE
jgi:putative flippase GtrA